jgi:hypothetical protein
MDSTKNDLTQFSLRTLVAFAIVAVMSFIGLCIASVALHGYNKEMGRQRANQECKKIPHFSSNCTFYDDQARGCYWSNIEDCPIIDNVTMSHTYKTICAFYYCPQVVII